MSQPLPEISGHPVEPLLDEAGNLIQMLTVCGHCGEWHSILFLAKDRWYCSQVPRRGRDTTQSVPNRLRRHDG